MDSSHWVCPHCCSKYSLSLIASVKVSYSGLVNRFPIIGWGLNSKTKGSLLIINPKPNVSNPASISVSAALIVV